MLNYNPTKFCDDITPTQILSIAIKKRRELYDLREPNMYRELLNKALIQHLCQQLGERRFRKSRRQRKKSRSSRKRRTEDEMNMGAKRPYISNDSGLYVDEDPKGENSSNALNFEVPTMVRSEEFDCDQMERIVENNGSVSIISVVLLSLIFRVYSMDILAIGPKAQIWTRTVKRLILRLIQTLLRQMPTLIPAIHWR